jgi:signal transduction histidine kinase
MASKQPQKMEACGLELSAFAKFPIENPNPILRLDRAGKILYANAASQPLLAEWKSGVGGAAPQFCRDLAEQALATGQRLPLVFDCDGKEISFDCVPLPEAGYVNLYGRDITSHKRAEKLRALMIVILEGLNRHETAEAAIREMLMLIVKHLGVNAAAIRLKDGEDFPYFVCDGLSVEFIKSENLLCLRNQDGGVRRDTVGRPCLACLCGSVLQGRLQPGMPCYTQGGSFWTNCASKLLAGFPPEKLPAGFRGRCNREGYESIALIPLRSGAETIGLLQLNDKRPDCFSLETVEFFEGLGASIGIALKRRQAERERDELLQLEKRARSEAEFANRAKDEFVAVLSHELRTPLTAILGWVKLLRGYDLDDEKRHKALEIIERNTKNQARLIEDLLEISRIITGKLVLNIGEVHLQRVIEAALETLRPAAEAKNINLNVQLTSSELVRGDASRLQQVIFNLLSNAIKFTPKGGCLDLRLEREGTYALLTVRDNGVGIEPEFLPFVFDRFRQADASTTRLYQGLGLGLAIVRHLVELHGGTVQVASEGKGKGAIFTVRLPVAAIKEKEPASPVPEPAAPQKNLLLAGLRILVVEDEPDSRELLTILLKEHGAEVRSAGSYDDALEQLALFRPNLLLSDIGLPGKDGYALVRALRARKPEEGGKITAIALSAYAKHEDRLKSLTAGYQAHIAKPVDPEELVALIGNFADFVRG